MLTLDDARKVIDEVLKRYKTALPAGLESKIRTKGAASIYFFLPESNYAPNFGAYFRSWFAATNINSCVGADEIKVCGKPQKLLRDIATSPVDPDDLADVTLKSHKDPIVPKGQKGWKPPPDTITVHKPDVYSCFACPAFTTPAVDVLERKIYVNQDSAITIGTLYHEFIHYLSHGNFYPEFYAQAGRSAIIVEGVTEYLTRTISPIVDYDRWSQQKYKSQLEDVTLKAGGVSKKTQEDFEELLFRGELKHVTKLGGTIPTLPKTA